MVIMAVTEKIMAITEAKAHLLAVVTELEAKRQPVLLTRNGRNVARLIPIEEEDPLAIYKFGGGRIVGDIDSPANDADDWEYD
jgi:prevent-host-death family protein